MNINLAIRYLKWFFTWALASLPIVFLLFKHYIQNGALGFDKICTTGELFLVFIVMVAEPLGNIISAKIRNSTSFLLVIGIFIMVLTCTYLFTIIELAREVGTSGIVDSNGICLSDEGCCHRIQNISIGFLISSLILGFITITHVIVLNDLNEDDA